MKKVVGALFLVGILFVSSCEYFEGLFDEEEGNELSTEEIIEGLKTALKIGADSSTHKLSVLDGYYMDAAVKILLPPEANVIYDNLGILDSKIPGTKALIEDQLEKMVVSINRSAEDAADDALPILTDAVTSLSISDGWDILNGKVPGTLKAAGEEPFDSLAATHYLENETKQELITVFSEPMNQALNKKLVFNISAYSLWNNITTTYNNAVEIYNLIPFVEDLNTVNRDLGEYVTGKAMDGLFLKVGEQERKIRRDPFQWAVDIIQEVFGYIQDYYEENFA